MYSQYPCSRRSLAPRPCSGEDLSSGHTADMNVRTSTIDPGAPRYSKDDCTTMGRTFPTKEYTSAPGPLLLNVEGKNLGGFSCMMRIPASDSHTAFRLRCTARQTSSSSGPAFSVKRVVSAGKEVIALKKSLNAYESEQGFRLDQSMQKAKS